MTKSSLGEFDRKIDIWNGKVPSAVIDAAVHVNDTMELATSSAMQVFGTKVKFSAADVIAIFDRMQAELHRQQRLQQQE